MLIQHADGVLAAARGIFGSLPVQLSVRIPGHHWWYNTASHAPEMTAGWVGWDRRPIGWPQKGRVCFITLFEGLDLNILYCMKGEGQDFLSSFVPLLF